ncbi:Alpha/Beta hydrolase protein [Lasiosphaeria hispida]|uniref:Alpha/Beta hydrolase protein n=1 Tax=Lasiosphaeria hispida TaxID=260671 RepID=A0AAJ0M7P5_9PEZI|nr:Alpha/Beta hydrolase protein [Lasiosphaeria hispida]
MQRLKAILRYLLKLWQRNPSGSCDIEKPSVDHVPHKQLLWHERKTTILPSPSFPDGVKILHDCPNPVIDICFIHGLTGDRETTWTAPGQSVPWPKSLLLPRFYYARILTYGYDAYIVRKSAPSSNGLNEHATNLLHDLTTNRAHSNMSSRPLIFVAHSLGGLVCKRVLLLSQNNPESHLRNIFGCVTGIIFLGTPHRGSWMADWARMPASALGVVKSTNTTLLEVLRTDSQFLRSIHDDFSAMIRRLQLSGRRIEITCFFEELPMPVVGKVVVTKESATLEGYNSISIHANHKEMVVFSNEGDSGFQRLLGELSRWITAPGRQVEIAQINSQPMITQSGSKFDSVVQSKGVWQGNELRTSSRAPRAYLQEGSKFRGIVEAEDSVVQGNTLHI